MGLIFCPSNWLYPTSNNRELDFPDLTDSIGRKVGKTIFRNMPVEPLENLGKMHWPLLFQGMSRSPERGKKINCTRIM